MRNSPLRFDQALTLNIYSLIKKYSSNDDYDKDNKINVSGNISSNFNFRRFIGFMGPGILISIAYIDPGNLDIDVKAGTEFNYSIGWIMLISLFLGFILQYLSIKVGIITGRGLAEICRFHYSNNVCILLWVISFISIICSDIPQVIGSAFALKILLRIPLSLGVILSASSLFFLFVPDFFNLRKIELTVGLLVFGVLVCIIIQFFIGNIDFLSLFKGFIPSKPNGSFLIIISLIGSIVVPFNLFLHSALVNTRFIEKNEKSFKEAISYNMIEFSLALFVCFVINIAFMSLSASEFYGKYDSVLLIDALKILKGVLGRSSSVLLSMAIFASSQCSIIATSLAGQYVTSGFIKIPLTKKKSAAITRSTAIIPSFLIALFASNEMADFLIIFTQAIISILLPFSLIPLIKFSHNEKLLGKYKNKSITTITAIVIGFLITLTNIVVFCQFLINKIKKASLFLKPVYSLCLFFLTIFYIYFLYYLATKKCNKKLTFLDYEVLNKINKSADDIKSDDDSMISSYEEVFSK